MKSACLRTGTIVAATAAAMVLGLLTAVPAATASPRAATLSITSAAVAADDTVNVTVTYTCDPGFTGTLNAYVNDVDASAFGGSDDVAATCDGTSRTAVLPVDNDNDATMYAPGDSAAVAAALDVTKPGAPDQNAAQDVTVTLG